MRTDGSCDPQSGVGGWAFKIRSFGNAPFDQSGAVPETPSMDAELIAISAALEYLPKRKGPILVENDCLFACDKAVLAWAKEIQFDQAKLAQEPKVVQRFFRALYRHEGNVTFEKVLSHGAGADHQAVHMAAKEAARKTAIALSIPPRENFGYPLPLPPSYAVSAYA